MIQLRLVDDALPTFSAYGEFDSLTRSRGGAKPEIKAVEQLSKAHTTQLLTYLKLSNTQVGLLINFGAPTLRDGLRRVVNGFVPSATSRLRVNQRLSENA